MSNTVSSTVFTPELVAESFGIMRNWLAPFSLFTISRLTDPVKPKSTHVVKFVTSAATPQVNATDFQVGDSKIDPVSVVVDCVSTSFQVSNVDLNSGLRIEDLVLQNAIAHAERLIDYPTALLTAANFGAPLLATPAATFTSSDLSPVRSAIGKAPIKNLILAPDYYSKISNHPAFIQRTRATPVGGTMVREPYQPMPYGFNAIAENSRFDAAESGVVGFACSPSAIVVVMGEPVIPTGPYKQTYGTERVGSFSLGIEVLLVTWFALATRTTWAAFITMIGASVGDATAGKLIKSS